MKKTTSKRTESYRADVLHFAAEKYGTQADYPWGSLPNYAVLRHADNKKWYGLIMDVPRKRLGLSGDEIVDILDIKCDPILSGSLRMNDGFLPSYHMNHDSWITILLDGTVDKETIFSLLDMSFERTASRQKKKRSGDGIQKAWIVPANPKYYDLGKAFSESDEILWKQSNHIAAGDLVYLYVTAPVSAILYQCQALEVEIPYEYDNGKIRMHRAMRLKRLAQYDPSWMPLDKLKEHGVFAVRGPRSMPASLMHEIEGIQS